MDFTQLLKSKLLANSAGRFQFGRGIFGKISVIAISLTIASAVLAAIMKNLIFCYVALCVDALIALVAMWQISTITKLYPNLAAQDNADWLLHVNVSLGAKSLPAPSREDQILISDTVSSDLPTSNESSGEEGEG